MVLIMTDFFVKKSTINGEITIPPSKSHTLRAILFASLAKGDSIIENYLPSPDALAMIEACRSLGANIEISKTRLNIRGIDGKIDKAEDVINAGNSGIVLRFIAAIAGLGTLPIVITGDHSIRHQRPMKPLTTALTQLNVSAISTKGDGFAPIIIQGPLKPGKAFVVGSDSQPVSALLIASAFASGPIEIRVENPGELPWISLTLGWFDKLGISYKNDNFETYKIPGRSNIKGFDYKVPGDFSSASFPIAAALVTNSEVTLKNLDINDSQGDKKLIYVLQEMGANIVVDAEQRLIHIGKGPSLKGIEIDINDFVDAIAILAVIGCYAEGETNIINAGVAREKECDRISCITKELKKMGAQIIEHAEGLTIKHSKLKGAVVHSHNDHRMVMSLAVAGLGAQGETEIRSVDCVSKTYPNFYDDFKTLKADIRKN